MSKNNFKIVKIENIENTFKKEAKKINNTRELNNIIFSYKTFSKDKIETISETDFEEREWLLKEVIEAAKEISKQCYTRKSIFYNLHVSELKHSCSNIFNFFYRKSAVHLNVYVRSMNFDNNMKQDLYTFQLLLEKMTNILGLPKGYITVFIMSLHSFKI